MLCRLPLQGTDTKKQRLANLAKVYSYGAQRWSVQLTCSHMLRASFFLGLVPAGVSRDTEDTSLEEPACEQRLPELTVRIRQGLSPGMGRIHGDAT